MPSKIFRESFDELAGIRYVGIYTVDGQTYFTLRNWDKHQRIDHPSKPLVPGPPPGFWDEHSDSLAQPSRDSRVTLAPDHDHDHDHDHDLDKDRELRADKAALGKPSAPKPVKGSKSRPAAGKESRADQQPDGYQLVMDCYFAEFERARGQKPVIGSRDGKAVKTLLSALSGDHSEACRYIKNAFSDSWWRSKVTISTIASDPSKFSSTQSNQSGRNMRPPQPNNDEHRIIPNRVLLPGETE
jgi:hypothetical protein